MAVKSRRPNLAECRHITRVLYGTMYNDGFKDRQFARCPARDEKKKIQFELEGDWSHSGARHVCGECQCSHVAGTGTTGKFWGEEDSWEEVGHHGVGWCATHEKEPRRKGSMEEFANNHMHAIQKAGFKGRGDFGLMAKSVSEKAMVTRKTRENISAIQSLMKAFYDNWEGEGKILTEKAGLKVISMTDKTKAETMIKIATAISKLELSEFKLMKGDYLPVEELQIRMPRMIELTQSLLDKVFEKYLHTDNDSNFKKELDDFFEDWKESLRDIWSSAKTADQR